MARISRLLHSLFIIAFTILSYESFSNGDIVRGVASSLFILINALLLTFTGGNKE